MKKIDDRVYEFFNLDYDDYNREDVAEDVTEDEYDDLSWLDDDEDDDLSWLDEGNESIDVVETKPKSKRDEIIDSLNYLKSKNVKTKQDRESIYTLEMVLKNMK